MQGRSTYRTAKVCSILAEEVDKWKLHAALTWHTAGDDEPQRFVSCRLFGASIKDDSCYRNNVIWQGAMSNRILSYELQQSWVMEVVPAFEDNMLVHQLRMLLQMST